MITIDDCSPLTRAQCQSARMSRDSRFDGQFFVAVKTTGIFCRPICPAMLPKESNVEYFVRQAQALKAGYRPCLRCRPDSAPGSWAWKGTETTFQRAVQLIDEGQLQQSGVVDLAERLGIGDRYLRALFSKYLGMSPKQYAQYNQLMFAKQLLHDSSMSISDIGLASGFNSVRRFNDAFQKVLRLTPSAVRKSKITSGAGNRLILSYRAPFNWAHLLAFYRIRAVEGVEEVGDDHYQRTFSLDGADGWFKASRATTNSLVIDFEIDDITCLRQLVARLRRMFDLDADLASIEHHLDGTPIGPLLTPGLRIPGVWNTWEAGLRAILGQQVSVKAAITQLNTLVSRLGERRSSGLFFPRPATVASGDLSFLKMPQRRKETVTRFAQYMVSHGNEHPNRWQSIKGIGPWTINYARVRGLSEPDCFLATDLVVKKAMATVAEFDHGAISPWGSYATFHCWNSQS